MIKNLPSLMAPSMAVFSSSSLIKNLQMILSVKSVTLNLKMNFPVLVVTVSYTLRTMPFITTSPMLSIISHISITSPSTVVPYITSGSLGTSFFFVNLDLSNVEPLFLSVFDVLDVFDASLASLASLASFDSVCCTSEATPDTSLSPKLSTDEI